SVLINPVYRYFRSLPSEHTVYDDVCPWLSPRFRRSLEGSRNRTRRSSRLSIASRFFFERIHRVSLMSGQLWNQLGSRFEVRYPLLYRPLVEFMHAIPWEQKISPSQNRVLHRRALSNILPESVRLRKDKQGPSEAIWEGFRRNPGVCELLTKNP